MTFLSARQDALEHVIEIVAVKSGLSQAKIHQLIRDEAKTAHEARLLKYEDVNPGLAATLDMRPTLLD